MSELQPELLLQAYAVGVFPMAEGRNDPRLFFVDPDNRGVLPFDGFHVSRSLRKTVRRRSFEVVWDRDFEATLDGCAEATQRRPDTWINPEIRRLYLALHARGHAHSVESWRDGRLVGGLYGVRLGGAFFGESMFSRATDASKVALVHLVAKLKASGFTLLDTQFITDHLSRFGALEIPRDDYRDRLASAIAAPVQFDPGADDWPSVEALLHEATQTS
ncbi:leucyl/phenylalanyl-tRNA--protein transferase [Thalassobaculum sp. OXR-137]|uniref:leucyl/phenylalanyl-tRNA--protein transferase n=1 Tax=Thalassobaculum sp. OXR-137 TaxID=3100173 RepID=UPI002AC9A593|nr:leucyl/phenylalanyl-tRNA--protein transferase [Thalassobaculum sp. OXR-137]WPZ34253.1 leucyl/phenylalanyl-tRNA--protein transferase [Thalassobaculum sp. OXR-137]